MIVYILTIFFVYHLLNYADITSGPACWLKRKLGPRWGYPLSCSFCFAFHVSLLLYIVGVVSGMIIFCAPVLHLFVDLAYQKLSGNCPPCGGDNS